MEQLYQQIIMLGQKFGAQRVVLFGSRARGDCRQRSDIDLAVYGAAKDSYYAFRNALEELPTLLEFDLVYVTNQTDPVLRENIEKEGVILMSRFQEKQHKLNLAVARLEEAVSDYARLPESVVRDGVIQRFEFCAELAWKTLREYLIDQGYNAINSPKAVMKQAYADGIVHSEQNWIDLMTARNLTSHIYDEHQAEQIFQEICNSYLPMFRELCAFFE